uniref:DUF1618 domain-containing protein n=1 Tax=Setaria italica TaxID=4555 RepID=K3Y2N8_SETIT
MAEEVLVDRYVLFEDELSEVTAERGGTPPSLTVESVLQRIAAAGLSGDEAEAAVERALDAVMSRYRAEIEAPAEAILRVRKAFRPSAVEKVVAAAALGGVDAASYREALEGIEPRLCRVAEPPGLTSLALRMSWPGDSALRHFPAGAFVSGADHNILALYVGPYRPGFAEAGFYLVYDAWANSVAVVPPLPPRSATMFSHCSIGTGVAVLRHGPPSDYVLVELLPRQDDRGLISNTATLFMWRSSGPVAGRWIQKEAVLPLPTEPPDEEEDDEDDASPEQPSYRFCADTAFAVGSTCLCWVDLLQGMLVCNDVLADHPEFRFVGLPEGCTVEPEHGRGDQHRSTCCVERGEQKHTIKFVSMDGYGQGRPISEVALITWTLDEPQDPRSEWKKAAAASICPVLSMLQDDVVYLELVDNQRLEEDKASGMLGGRCYMSLDMRRRRVLSVFKFSPGSRCFPPPDIFASRFTMYLNKGILGYINKE